MKRRIILLALAVVSAIGCTLAIWSVTRPYQPAQQTVFMAVQGLDAFSRVSPAGFRWATSLDPPPGAVSTLPEGSILRVPLVRGAVLLENHLAPESTVSREVAARLSLQAGERLVGVPVTGDTSLGGMGAVGDRVDVVATYDGRLTGLAHSSTVAEYLLVADVRNRYGSSTDTAQPRIGGADSPLPAVVVVVLPKEAVESLVLALSQAATVHLVICPKHEASTAGVRSHQGGGR